MKDGNGRTLPSSDGLLSLWKDEYETLISAGLKPRKAKIAANRIMEEAYPTLKPTVDAATNLRVSGKWAEATDDMRSVAEYTSGKGTYIRLRNLAEVKRLAAIAANGNTVEATGVAVMTPASLGAVSELSVNGNGRDVTDADTNGNGKYSPTDDMVAYVTHLDPEIGDVFTMNLHYLAFEHGKASDSAWRQAFTSLRMRQAGWEFEVVEKSGRAYQLKVTARPARAEAPMDVDALREQIRAEVLAGMQDEIGAMVLAAVKKITAGQA